MPMTAMTAVTTSDIEDDKDDDDDDDDDGKDDDGKDVDVNQEYSMRSFAGHFTATLISAGLEYDASQDKVFRQGWKISPSVLQLLWYRKEEWVQWDSSLYCVIQESSQKFKMATHTKEILISQPAQF